MSSNYANSASISGTSTAETSSSSTTSAEPAMASSKHQVPASHPTFQMGYHYIEEEWRDDDLAKGKEQTIEDDSESEPRNSNSWSLSTVEETYLNDTQSPRVSQALEPLLPQQKSIKNSPKQFTWQSSGPGVGCGAVPAAIPSLPQWRSVAPAPPLPPPYAQALTTSLEASEPEAPAGAPAVAAGAGIGCGAFTCANHPGRPQTNPSSHLCLCAVCMVFFCNECAKEGVHQGHEHVPFNLATSKVSL